MPLFQIFVPVMNFVLVLLLGAYILHSVKCHDKEAEQSLIKCQSHKEQWERGKLRILLSDQTKLKCHT